jgi:hypothetical protein
MRLPTPPASGQYVLRGEQPVVAAEVHGAADSHRLTEQRHAKLPRSSPATAWVKNTHTCAPRPDRDTSRAAGTVTARAALT